MTRTLLCFFFSLSAISSYAQQIMITGKITIDNIEESYDLSSITVENLETNTRIKSNPNGIFSIKVKEGESLRFTSGFTQERFIKITSSILSKGYINVHLDLEVIELAEANLNPLKKNLKENISKEKTEQEKMYESIGFNEAFKLDMIKYRLALSYLKKYKGNTRYENVLKLKDDFTDDAKKHRPEIRKEKPATIRMEEIITIKTFFTENYFTEYLSIPSNKIIDFVAYCYDTHHFKNLLKNQRYEDMFYHFETEAANFLERINS